MEMRFFMRRGEAGGRRGPKRRMKGEKHNKIFTHANSRCGGAPNPLSAFMLCSPMGLRSLIPMKLAQ